MQRNRAAQLAILLFGPLLGCSPSRPSTMVAGPRLEGERIAYAADAPELSVLAVAAARPASWSALRTTGRLAWDEDLTARVYSPVSGRVSGPTADVERAVSRGEALAVLESPDLGQAQADADRAATDLAAAERNLARIRALWASDAAAKKDLDDLEAEVARDRVESERARNRLALLGGLPGAPAERRQRYRLRSPVRGVVVDRAINPGQEVRSDAQVPLFTVSDPTRLWVYLDVTEKDLPHVRRGLALAVRAAAYPDRVFHGRVEVVGDALDPATRTVKARGVLDNPNRLLKAEMYVDVELSDPALLPGLEIPSAAVVADGPRSFVFVEEGRGHYRRQAVVTGPERAGRTQILGGLAPGQRVVVEGSLLLQSVLSSRA